MCYLTTRINFLVGEVLVPFIKLKKLISTFNFPRARDSSQYKSLAVQPLQDSWHLGIMSYLLVVPVQYLAISGKKNTSTLDLVQQHP